MTPLSTMKLPNLLLDRPLVAATLDRIPGIKWPNGKRSSIVKKINIVKETIVTVSRELQQ
jgi:hypothetical protein